MPAAVTARTSEGQGQGRGRERIVPVEPIRDVPAMATVDRQWVDWAVKQLHSDAQRSADTHLLRLPTPVGLSVDLYLKDESTHPTGSLKHRLARSLFLYAICSGDIGRGTTVVEASSGSTAISEAYFARLLGLSYVAVMARSTSQGKIALIEREVGVPDAASVATRSGWPSRGSTSSPTWKCWTRRGAVRPGRAPYPRHHTQRYCLRIDRFTT